MNHWGKVIGAFVGYLLAGIFGAGVGCALGFLVDRFLVIHHPPRFTKIDVDNLSRIRSEFFTASFSVMGYVSKASGGTEDVDIAYAMKVINRMGLPVDSRDKAIELFNEGKTEDFSLHKVVSQFYLDCRDQPSLLEMFLEIQLYAAFGSGDLTDSEKDIIQNIAYQLDFSAMEFERIENLIRAECRHSESNTRKRRQADEQWEQRLAQDRIKEQELQRKQKLLQQKAQKKAYAEQERTHRKAQVDQQRTLYNQEKAAYRAKQESLRRQEKEQRERQRQQKKTSRQGRSHNNYAYEGARDNWSSDNSSPLDDAYAMLNMPQTASNDDIKKAYRRLTSKHHPDKLIAKGLPKETMKDAEIKTREIRAAYDHIREVRNF